MQNVTDRVSNPFGFRPDCERFVPGYGDANADFHVVGDHPKAHGGVDTGVPFTGTAAAERLQDTLLRAGLLKTTGDRPTVADAYLSYLHLCVPEGDEPTAAAYADAERFLDTEVRAITAHVLLPVGQRATQYVLDNYTARARTVDEELDGLHATEVRGAGWLVFPVRDPREWADGDGDALVDALTRLRQTDYRRESDLGRFLPGDDPYRVR
ncbi:uracil-DNA glycosylase family protein [Halobaculum sp. MBLA0143]|uniref:uracil-DNA glycosylase family protein n=1 Tax=Halobaculum sp. MBLA0143 TaxID=3079933 RepID=UPI003523A55F